MTWTYDETAIATTPLYQVRFLIGDTDTSNQQIPDETINWQLTDRGVYFAAASCAEAIAAMYARNVNRRVGQMSLNASDRMKHYQDLAAALRMQGATLGGAPYAGGISVADKTTNRLDSDRVAPAFWTDMEKNPGNLSPSDEPIQDWNQ